MSVTETITSMQKHTADVWAKIEKKGGTIPAQKNIDNLAEAIRSIGGN